MREILFRGIARDFNSRDWVYGSLLDKVYGGYPAILTDAAIEDDGALFVQPTYVERDSISQYTGKKDKNGVKIFEGDIVEFVCTSFRMVGNVVYIENRYMINDIYDGEQDWEDWKELEVIGNIYDNPELLEDIENEN